MNALITQRQTLDSYGVPVDLLESPYVTFFSQLGVTVWPVSNFTPDPQALADSLDWDLLILTGGGSVPNGFYDQPVHDPQQELRDRVEQQLAALAVERNIPILGICRGMQFLNGLYGGKISRLAGTWNVPRPVGKDHPVELCTSGEILLVNNFHNDGIRADALAPLFTPLAMDEENGVVEAFTCQAPKILGIQWHPERRFETEQGKNASAELVKAFIACQCRHR